MLTLEQVRTINQSLQQGDVNAALRPLEETIDLRNAELPRLEKASVAALKDGLNVPQNAQIWAEAALHPNVSLRRFVRKTFLALRGEGAPIAEPLKRRLEQFLADEQPLPMVMTAREAAARREQVETVEGSLEILLRANADVFMGFYSAMIEASIPAQKRRQSEAEEWRKRYATYSQAIKRLTDEAIRDNWGAEFLHEPQRSQLPSRVWREIRESVQNAPEIVQYTGHLGDNPWATSALDWQPQQLFPSILNKYLHPEATGPQREVAAHVRRHLWQWIEQAFDTQLPNKQREQSVIFLKKCAPRHLLSNWLDREEIWKRLPTLLEKSKPGLLQSLAAALKRYTHYSQGNEASDLWLMLTVVLAESSRRPYYIKPEAWHLPDSITPQLIRSFKTGNADQTGREAQLEVLAKQLEKERQPARPAISQTHTPPATPTLTVTHQDLSREERMAAMVEAEKSGQNFTEILNVKCLALQSQIETIKSLEEKTAKLLDPTETDQSRSLRSVFWKVWSASFGRERLISQLWPLVGPKLWARYEAKLEDYRKVEIAEIAPKLGEKLTEREQKEWKTAQRNLERQRIKEELDSIGFILKSAEGFEAELKLLHLLKRPGLKDLHRIQQRFLLNQLSHLYSHDQKNLLDTEWLRQNWFLEAKWAPLIAEIEADFRSQKRLSDWEIQNFQRDLAVAYYRLNTPESRERFHALADSGSNQPHQFSTVVTTFGDVESWLILVANIEWPDAHLKELWKQTRERSREAGQQLTTRLLELAATTAKEKPAKFMLEMLAEAPAAELEPNATLVFQALESSLIPVKRWALTALSQLPPDAFDAEAATSLAGEMLWNENGALVKEAIKFLSQRQAEAVPTAWGALQEATSLENIPLLETIFRALSTLKTKNKTLTLELDESAKEKLTSLLELAPERFNKFSAKLLAN